MKDDIELRFNLRRDNKIYTFCFLVLFFRLSDYSILFGHRLIFVWNSSNSLFCCYFYWSRGNDNEPMLRGGRGRRFEVGPTRVDPLVITTRLQSL